MLAYSVIMFLAAALFLVCSIAVYRGKTDLIQHHHQTKVTDKAAYGKAFGKALSVFAAAPLLSGVVGLFAAPRQACLAAVAVLLIGLAVGTGLLVAVQRKYNRGIF